MSRKLLCAWAAAAAFTFAGRAGADIVINEIDSDTPSTDVAEFVELYSTTGTTTSLTGLTLVLFNGNGDVSYKSIDLDGQSTDSRGYFVLGNTGVVGADNTSFLGANNTLQNGADAVALYLADATAFPNGTAPTTTNLIDAIVYDTGQADDTGLLTGLGQSTQYNEDGAGDATIASLARLPNGTGAFAVGTPTADGGNAAVPEPAGLALMGLGALASLRRRRRV